MSGAQQPGGAAPAAPMPAPSQDLAPMQAYQAYKSAPNMALLNQQPQQQAQPWQPPTQQYQPAAPAIAQQVKQRPSHLMHNSAGTMQGAMLYNLVNSQAGKANQITQRIGQAGGK